MILLFLNGIPGSWQGKGSAVHLLMPAREREVGLLKRGRLLTDEASSYCVLLPTADRRDCIYSAICEFKGNPGVQPQPVEPGTAA